jgi:hypothetical protein
MSKITISDPKKVVEGNLAGIYVCEVYLPDIVKNNPIYADSPDEADKNANIFVDAYLKEKVKSIERLLTREDIKKSLAEELVWAKRQLAERGHK